MSKPTARLPIPPSLRKIWDGTGDIGWEPRAGIDYNEPVKRLLDEGWLKRCVMRCGFEAMNSGVRWTKAAIAAFTADTDRTRLRAALEALETANEVLAAGRSQTVYDAMLAAGQGDALANLDDARRNARALLAETAAVDRPDPAQMKSEAKEPG